MFASTGVIGQPLSIDPIANGMKPLVADLGRYSERAAAAIMTTDTKIKELSCRFTIKGKECRIGGIAKGSGMKDPS